MQCHVFDQRGEPEPLFGEQSAVTFAGFGDTILALPTGEGQSTKNSHYCFTRVFLAFWWGVNTCLKQQKSLSLNLLTNKERRAQEQKQTQEEVRKHNRRKQIWERTKWTVKMRKNKNEKIINPLGRKEVKNCALRWTKIMCKNRFVDSLDPDPIEPHPRKMLPHNEKKSNET